MTPAPPLPDLLAALAQRVPERFEVADAANGSVFYYAWRGAAPGFTGHFAHVYTRSPLPELLGDALGRGSALILEDALREECESRGWEWGIVGNATQTIGTVWRQGDTPDHCHVAIAPTPAHALACAMVAALSAEGEG